MVSVVLAAYNGGEYIKAQLESVLGQLGENDEVIISDDKPSGTTKPAVEDILSNVSSFSGDANKGAQFIKEKLPYAKSIVDNLVDTMDKINKSDDVTELISLLKSDVLQRSDFLKQPVNLVEKKLYPIKNYGSGMTPFYTVLSSLSSFVTCSPVNP